MQNKAQGTIEYLVILAVIAVVALVVVTLMINSTAPSQNVSTNLSQISSQTSPISIQEAIVTEDGNYFLKLQNNTGENVKLKTIEVGGNEGNPERKLSAGNEEGFLLNSETLCSEGEIVSEKIIIIYETETGLEKRQTYSTPLSIECQNFSITTVYTNEEGTTFDETGDPIGQFCGNNIVENGEFCDGTDVNGSCTDYGYSGGTITCGSGCSEHILSGCTAPILLSSDGTGGFLESENLIATVSGGKDPSKTYSFSWHKNGSTTPEATTIIEDGLTSYWPLDNDYQDYAGSNNATIAGDTHSVEGQIDDAYNFDGYGDYLSITDNPTVQFTTGLTISLWANLDTYGPTGYGQEHGYWVSKGLTLWWNPSYFLGYSKGGGTGPATPMFHVKREGAAQNGGGTTISAYSNINSGEWHHIVGTFDNSTAKIYVDGNFENSVSYAGPIQTSDGCNMFMGGGSGFGPPYGGSCAFQRFTSDGTIDETMIFNRALTESEVVALYEGSRYSGTKLDANMLSVGEQWRVGFRTNDGTGWTSEQLSNIITIK